ncbi:MAG: cytochrome c peroxidase [Porticoccaceae bacterium]|nr:cytochrome c peroxidase [Porticoccaceae bacterium]
MKRVNRIITASIISLLLVGCGGGGSDETPVFEPVIETPPDTSALEVAMQSASFTNSIDFYLLPDSDDYENIPQDSMNPITAEKVAVGQLIYHDPAFATEGIALRAKTWSCASCHHARAGFKSGMTQGLGEGGEGFGIKGESRRWHDADIGTQDADVQPVTSPTVLNVAYQDVMLWNGALGNSVNGVINAGIAPDRLMTEGTPKAANSQGFSGIETQAIAGTGVHRIGSFPPELEETEYYDLLLAAFPQYTMSELAQGATASIAAFERTVLANKSPFQLWLRGDEFAMTEQQISGAEVFFGSGGCYGCHQGAAFSSPVGATADQVFFAVGFDDLDVNEDIIGQVADGVRLGRGGFTGNPLDDYKFKVPQLYNLADTNVFGHGGSFSSVREVVEYKNNAVAQNEASTNQLDYRFSPLGLSDEELTDLVVFLEEALRDPDLMRYEPESLPSGLCVINNDPTSRNDLGCD